MKITKQYLTQVIKEELEAALSEKLKEGEMSPDDPRYKYSMYADEARREQELYNTHKTSSLPDIDFDKNSKEQIEKTLEKILKDKIEDKTGESFSGKDPFTEQFEMDLYYIGRFDASKKPDIVQFEDPQAEGETLEATVISMDDDPGPPRPGGRPEGDAIFKFDILTNPSRWR